METKQSYNNDIKISYVKSGKGQPIILLHGNFQSNEVYHQLIGKLTKDNYEVFAPDTRSFGKSDKAKRLNYNDIAEDIKILIEKEQIKNPILFGFSNGGVAGLLLAIKYPNLLKKLVVSGINLNPKGIALKYRIVMKIIFFFTRKDNFRLMLTQPDITSNQLKKITTPTTVLYGEKDIVDLKQSEEAVENVKNGKLMILDGEDHASHVIDNNKLYKILKDII